MNWWKAGLAKLTFVCGLLFVVLPVGAESVEAPLDGFGTFDDPSAGSDTLKVKAGGNQTVKANTAIKVHGDQDSKIVVNKTKGSEVVEVAMVFNRQGDDDGKSLFRVIGVYIPNSGDDGPEGQDDASGPATWYAEYKHGDVSDLDGKLVLIDKVAGGRETDKTNTEDDPTPHLICGTDSEGQGHVEFVLNVDSGSYDWAIIKGGTLNDANKWKHEEDSLPPGKHTLTVAGEDGFRRKIQFDTVGANLQPKAGRFPKCCNAGIEREDFVIDTNPADYRDEVNLEYEQTYQDSEVTKTSHKYADGTFRKTVVKLCKAKLGGTVIDTCFYNLVPPGEWNKTWAEVEKELDQTLPHVGHPSVVHRETNTWEDWFGREHTAHLVVTEEYKFKKTGAANQGQHAELGIGHCFEAMVEQNFSVGAYGLNYGVSANWSTSTEYNYGYSPPSTSDGRVWQIRGYQKHYRVWTSCWQTIRGPLGSRRISSDDDTRWLPLYHCCEGVRWKCTR